MPQKKVKGLRNVCQVNYYLVNCPSAAASAFAFASSSASLAPAVAAVFLFRHYPPLALTIASVVLYRFTKSGQTQSGR